MSSAVRTVTDEATGVALDLPPGWERVEVPGIPLAVAGPPTQALADGTPFRPNVTVLVVPAAEDADVRTLGTEAIAAATVQEDAHVLAYDLWLRPGGVGRRLEVAASALVPAATEDVRSVPVDVTQWVALEDGMVTTVTATCGVAQLLDQGPVIEALVATLRPVGGAR